MAVVGGGGAAAAPAAAANQFLPDLGPGFDEWEYLLWNSLLQKSVSDPNFKLTPNTNLFELAMQGMNVTPTANNAPPGLSTGNVVENVPKEDISHRGNINSLIPGQQNLHNEYKVTNALIKRVDNLLRKVERQTPNKQKPKSKSKPKSKLHKPTRKERDFIEEDSDTE